MSSTTLRLYMTGTMESAYDRAIRRNVEPLTWDVAALAVVIDASLAKAEEDMGDEENFEQYVSDNIPNEIEEYRRKQLLLARRTNLTALTDAEQKLHDDFTVKMARTDVIFSDLSSLPLFDR